jgi:hypothetical protein
MGQAVQAEVEARIQRVGPADLAELADVEGFRIDFLRAHGFEVEGVDYSVELSPLGLPLDESPSDGKSPAQKAAIGKTGGKRDAWRRSVPTTGGLI